MGIGVFTIILISISLAMDAFAVSISNGLILKKFSYTAAFKFGLFFGVFQFIMTAIGFFGAKIFSGSFIAMFDHWIAFILLAFVGGKMIYETFKEDEDEFYDLNTILSFKNLLTLAIATSIDALAVGISFAFILTGVLYAATMIGVITFALSFLGVAIGSRIGGIFQKGAERVGGIVLIIIGAKILIEHLFFS